MYTAKEDVVQAIKDAFEIQEAYPEWFIGYKEGTTKDFSDIAVLAKMILERQQHLLTVMGDE